MQGGRKPLNFLQPEPPLTCGRSESFFFGTDRNGAASIDAMIAASEAARVTLVRDPRTDPDRGVPFEDTPGFLTYDTVGDELPIEVWVSWEEAGRMKPPSDFTDSTEPEPFLQYQSADAASWWPAAIHRYRYIVEFRAQWTYYILDRGDASSPSVQPS